MLEAAALAARIQAPILFPNVELPSSDYFWTEDMSWACHTFNCSTTTSIPDSKSPHEMWHGSPPRRHLLPFFNPGYYKAKRTNKLQPRAQECFYLGPGRNHPRDSVRVLTNNNSVITTRNGTWQHTPPRVLVGDFLCTRLSSSEIRNGSLSV